MNQYLEDILNLVVSFENLTDNEKKTLSEAINTAFSEASRLVKQRDAELAVINSVQQALLDHMDMKGIYNMVGDRIRELFDAQVTGIYTFDHDTNLEHFQYLFEDGERLYPESRPLNQIRKWLIQNATMLLVNENADEVVFNITGEAHVPVPGTRLPKSMIFVPLIVGDVVQGCVSLQNLDRENAFTDSDIRLINTLTNSMSFALENARLFNETARLLKTTESRAAELETVNQISKALVSQLKFDSLVQLVGEKMRETFNADIVFLALHDRESNMIHFPYYYGDSSGSRPFGNGITENIILSKEPLLVNHDLEDIYEKMKADKSGKWVQSFLGVPITVGDQAIGVISVQSTELANRFDENDQRLLSTIASNVGVAMQNAEAYQKLQQALSELRSTQSQLIHSEKMASLGELTAGIAHEIQNPLNFVNNYSGVSTELIDEMIVELLNGNKEDAAVIAEDVKQNLVVIGHHGKRAETIVKGMLQHSRSSTGVKEPTDINGLTDEYVRLSYHGLKAKDKSFNVSIKTDYDASIGKINIISQDVGRVILNLLTNAFYAVNEKKKSKIEGYEPRVTISTKKLGNKIEIQIADNGSGIPQKVLDKIFQPFFTTKPTGQGTGLGLSLSYDIITKAHEGELKVETKEGEGTTFLIYLKI